MTAPNRLAALAPGIVAATSFALSDVFGKIALNAGTDVLTLLTFRSLFSLVVLWAWLRLRPAAVPHTPRQRWISLGLGVLFAGIIYGLFKAVEIIDVSTAVLTYFAYPLLTGIIGAWIGIDRIGWRGALAAIAAFAGLALIVGAHPGGIAIAGLSFAFGAAVLRTAFLLITRGMLQGADVMLVTWYTIVSSTAIFVVVSLATLTWATPQTAYGWFALIVVSISVTVAVLALFMSIARIGPFRSALIMNLEPLLATLMSAPLLGELFTPLQALGGAVMLGALVAFQIRR